MEDTEVGATPNATCARQEHTSPRNLCQDGIGTSDPHRPSQGSPKGCIYGNFRDTTRSRPRDRSGTANDPRSSQGEVRHHGMEPQDVAQPPHTQDSTSSGTPSLYICRRRHVPLSPSQREGGDCLGGFSTDRVIGVHKLTYA